MYAFDIIINISFFGTAEYSGIMALCFLHKAIYHIVCIVSTWDRPRCIQMSICSSFKAPLYFILYINNQCCKTYRLQGVLHTNTASHNSQQINLQNWCSPHFLLVAHFLLVDHIQQLDQDYYQQTCGTPGTLHTICAVYVRA
jgi:hypothetical protein